MPRDGSRRRADAAGVPRRDAARRARRRRRSTPTTPRWSRPHGGTVVIVPGETRNLKLTVAGDLELAQALLDTGSEPVRHRVGLGLRRPPVRRRAAARARRRPDRGRAAPRRPLRRRRGRPRRRRRAARPGRAPRSRHAVPRVRRHATATPTRSRCCATSRRGSRRTVGGSTTSTSWSPPRQPKLAPHIAAMVERLVDALAPAREPMGHGIAVVGEAQARRGPRRDRPRRGHRGVGGRAPRAQLTRRLGGAIQSAASAAADRLA